MVYTSSTGILLVYLNSNAWNCLIAAVGITLITVMAAVRTGNPVMPVV